MHRIDTNGAVDGLFQMGNPAIGQQATLIDADWLNAVQENIAQTIEGVDLVLAKGNNTQLLAAIKLAAQIGGLPAGAIGHFACSSAPTGWLKANGAVISRTAYAGLFAAIGTSFGAGDGATTFALPDARGEFFRALDDGRGVDSGRTLGSAQASQNLSHRHRSPTQGGANEAGYEVPSTNFVAYDFTSASGLSAYTDYDGGSEARPRNVAWLACIKF